MPNKTNRYARKPTAKPASAPAKSPMSAALAASNEADERHEIFKKNLPTFHVDCLRGNAVADGETFTAQSGEDYYTFRLAYTRMRHGTKSTMFIKVIGAVNASRPLVEVSKGDYVEVSGDYSDDGVTPGVDGYGPSVFRTLFMGEDDTCKVLIG